MRGVTGRDVGALAELGAHRQERRVPGAVVQLGGEVVDT
jgi:hypothetical protein